VRRRDLGVTGTILAAKADSGVDVDRVLDAFHFGPPEASGDGWLTSAAHRDADRAMDSFEALVDALGGPAIVVKVLPSGWAYLIASEPESEPTVLVLTPMG
jgi:hypothetical protein